MLPAATVRTLTSVSCSPSIALHFKWESGRQTNGASKARTENNDIGSTGRPAAAKGGSVPPLR